MSDSNDELFDFPCDFPIKAMGLNHANFAELVVTTIERHSEGTSPVSVVERPSSNGKYLSVTVTIRAQSRDQLDNIYRDLTAEERVVMAL